MEPISVAASVWGVLEAAERIIGFFSSIADAPNTAANVLTECRAIFNQVNDFISDQDQQNITQKARISLNDLVATLTGCVTAFSELYMVLESLGTTLNGSDYRDYQFTFVDKIRWRLKEKSIEKILRNMQMHKTSLNLMISIYSRSVATCFDDFSSSILFNDLPQSLRPRPQTCAYHTAAAAPISC